MKQCEFKEMMIMKLQNLHIDIVNELNKIAESEASEERVAWFKQQHKGSKINSYGIKTPQVRKLIKKYNANFQQLDLHEKFSLAVMLYKSWIFEQTTIGNALLELSFKSITPETFDSLDEVVSHFNNWASVDRLCLHVMQPLLQKYPKETLKLLKEWNRSENMWKRRASVVSFVWKVGSSGKFTDEVLKLCENLLWDREELVKKGVGWALRDNIQGNKKQVLNYIKSLRRRGVSSIITLYAISNLKGKEREEILKVKS